MRLESELEETGHENSNGNADFKTMHLQDLMTLETHTILESNMTRRAFSVIRVLILYKSATADLDVKTFSLS